MQRFARRCLALALTTLLAPCISAAAQEYSGREKLRAQSNEFRKEVVRVTDGVYVAVGYSASNVILIQGDGGSIIVDTATDPVAARAIRTAFGDLFAAPVRAIIYTHSHPDHTGGSRVFAGNRSILRSMAISRFGASPDVGRAGRDGGDQFGMTLPDVGVHQRRRSNGIRPGHASYARRLPASHADVQRRPIVVDGRRRTTAAPVHARRNGGRDLGLAAREARSDAGRRFLARLPEHQPDPGRAATQPRGLDHQSGKDDRAGARRGGAESHAPGSGCCGCAYRADGVSRRHQVHPRPDD